MANIKGQIKRNKQNVKRNLFNSSFKSSMKTAMKKVEVSVSENDKAKAVEAYSFACKKLDKAVAKNIVHKNYAARNKSRLAGLVNTIK